MGNLPGDLPLVNEAAFFLDQASPSTVEALNQRGQLYRELTQIGVLGGKDQTDPSMIRQSLIVRADILSEALRVAVEKSRSEGVRIQALLRSLKRARFVSSFVSVVSSSGVIGVTLFPVEKIHTVVLASLTLVANGAGVFAEALILGPRQKPNDLSDAIRALSRISGYADITRRILSGLRETDFDIDEVKGMVKEANSRFSELNEVLAKIAA